MEAIAEGAACLPNLSPGARHLRVRIARMAGVGAAAALVVVIALGLPWWARALALFIPTSVALISFLEARSNVCIIGAVGGTFENDDRSKVAMDPAALPAVRRVATSLSVRAVVLALPVAIAAALTALLH
jgi:hypothetical protein